MIEPVRPAIVNRLRSRGTTAGVTVERVTIGEAAVLVELADVCAEPRFDPELAAAGEGTRTAGLAHRPPGESVSTDDVDLETLLGWATLEFDDSVSVSDRDGAGTGESARSDATVDGDTALRIALGVAAINALSSPSIEWRTGDPMALLDPSVDAIATVGSFGPAFRKFSDVDVRVIERGDVVPVSTPDDVGVTTFQPAEAIAAMADADVVAGADVVALDRVRDALRQGACGTDLHDAGVRKVYTVADGVADPDGGRGDRGDRTNL